MINNQIWKKDSEWTVRMSDIGLIIKLVIQILIYYLIKSNLL